MGKVKSKPLVFSNQASVRSWLEHGAGKSLLRQLTEAQVRKATEHLAEKIDEGRLLQRQSVLVVLESDGQLREIYGTNNVSVAVRAMLVHDEADDLEAEEYLTATLPHGMRRELTVGGSGLPANKTKTRSRPILNQTAEMEESRLNKLAVLRALQNGTWKELLEVTDDDIPI